MAAPPKGRNVVSLWQIRTDFNNSFSVVFQDELYMDVGAKLTVSSGLLVIVNKLPVPDKST